MLKVFWAATCVAKWISILCSLGLNSQRGTECVIKALWFLNWWKLLPTFYSAGIGAKHTALNQFQPHRESWKSTSQGSMLCYLPDYLRPGSPTTPPRPFFMSSLRMPPRFLQLWHFFFFSPFAKRYGLIGVIYYDTEMRGFVLVEWCNALSNMWLKYHKLHLVSEKT